MKQVRFELDKVSPRLMNGDLEILFEGILIYASVGSISVSNFSNYTVDIKDISTSEDEVVYQVNTKKLSVLEWINLASNMLGRISKDYTDLLKYVYIDSDKIEYAIADIDELYLQNVKADVITNYMLVNMEARLGTFFPEIMYSSVITEVCAVKDALVMFDNSMVIKHPQSEVYNRYPELTAYKVTLGYYRIPCTSLATIKNIKIRLTCDSKKYKEYKNIQEYVMYKLESSGMIEKLKVSNLKLSVTGLDLYSCVLKLKVKRDTLAPETEIIDTLLDALDIPIIPYSVDFIKNSNLTGIQMAAIKSEINGTLAKNAEGTLETRLLDYTVEL